MILITNKNYLKSECNQDLILRKDTWTDYSGEKPKKKRGYILSYVISGDIKRTTSAKEMMEFLMDTGYFSLIFINYSKINT